MKKFLKITALFLLLFVLTAPKAHAAAKSIQGEDRIETAIKISQEKYNESNYVILVDGYNFPDALSAISLAREYDGPILLTNPKQIAKETLNEIKRLSAKNVLIVGGYPSVAESIENQLKSNGLNTQRFAGSNRYETNRIVNEHVFKNKNVLEVLVANGQSFPDILSAAGYAYQNHIPILLSDLDGNQIKNFNQTFGRPDRTYLIGGRVWLSVQAERNSYNPLRLSGDNRYQTSNMVDRALTFKASKVYVTSGDVFADAIAGAPLITEGAALRILNSKVSELGNDQREVTIIGGRIKDDRQQTNQPKEVLNIFVVPHQDDETLSMGLAMLQRRNQESHVILTTDGGESVAINRINQKLSSASLPNIDKKEFANARTREMIAAISHANVPKERVHLLDLPQFHTNKQAIINEIAKIVNQYGKDKEIHLHGLASDGRIDASAGIKDHLLSKQAIQEYAKANSNINTHFYLGAYDITPEDKPVLDADYTRVEDTTLNELWQNMLNEYKVYKPEIGRYAVGYTSMEKYFPVLENDFHLFIER